MSIRLGEAHYQFTIDDEGLVAGLKRARARVRTEASAMAADIRRVGASFDAISQRSGRAARQVEADMRRIRSAQRERGVGAYDLRSDRQGRGRGRRGRSGAGDTDRRDRTNDDGSSRVMGAAKLASGIADTFSSISSGMSPAMAALKHGPQLLEAMAQAGLRLGPVGAIVTALAGGMLVLGANVMRTQKDLQTFGGQIEALAHGSHYSAEAMAEMARYMDVQGASAEEARQSLSAFMREGVAPERVREFSDAATHLSKVMGMDVVEASKEVSEAFTGNFEDVAKLDDSLHFLTDSERKHIQALFDSGKASDARNEAFSIFTTRYAKAYNEALSSADRLAISLAGTWDTLVESISNTQAIQDATKFIGDLIDKMANWLNQFIAIRNMSETQLKAEKSRIGKRLANPKVYEDEANREAILSSMSPIPGLFKPRSATQLRREEEQRLAEIAAQQQAIADAKNVAITATPPPTTLPARRSASVSRQTPVAQTVGEPVVTAESVLGKLPEALRERALALWTEHKKRIRDEIRQQLLNMEEGPITPIRQEEVGVLKEPDIVPFEETLKDIPRLATPIKDMAFEIGTSFSDAFGRAVAGMTTFEEAFKSTLQNMVAKWASSGFEKILGMLIGGNAAQDAGFGGGGIFGQGWGSGSSDGWMMNLMDFAGFRAGGGPVEAGRAYVVGEKRPELFVPRVSGTILPHVNATAGGPMIVRVEVDKSKYFDVHVNAVSARNARAAAGRAVEIANQTAYGSVRRSDTYEAA